jgi:leucyl aminopeptidase (aminopeptidase T)
MARRYVPVAQRARLCVETSLAVQEGENVLIVSDDPSRSFADSLAAVSLERGAEAVVLHLPVRKIYDKDPPEMVAAAMQVADVIFVTLPPEHACQLWHTSARQTATEAGARVGLVFPPATWDITPAQIEGTQVLTENLAKLLDAASHARLTTPAGTDLTMDLSGREGFGCVSVLHNPGDTATIPDWGDAEIAPVENTSEGTVVYDGSMTFIGKISHPITVTVRAGHAVDVTGGEEAARLDEILNGASGDPRNIAEFGIGTVPRGRITGHKDDHLLGTAHIALGHNITLGGTVESNIHLDGVMRHPTIVLDGRPVMTSGIPDPVLYEVAHE